MNTMPQPWDLCPNPCPTTPKGFNAKACWASTVKIGDSTRTLLGQVESGDVGSCTYIVSEGSPDPKIGDKILIEGRGEVILTGVEIDPMHVINVIIWDESSPVNPSGDDTIYLIEFIPRETITTHGCSMQSSLISKADAEAKALAKAKEIAALRMSYILSQ